MTECNVHVNVQAPTLGETIDKVRELQHALEAVRTLVRELTSMLDGLLINVDVQT